MSPVKTNVRMAITSSRKECKEMMERQKQKDEEWRMELPNKS